MHPAMFAAFDRLCRRRRAGGDVLELGAVPAPDTLLLLPALDGARSRLGLSLDGPHAIGGIEIRRGDATAMALPDRSFDTILCNSTLEHEPRFWRALAEIRRVARPGALIALGVPAYTQQRYPLLPALPRLARRLPLAGTALARRLDWLAAAIPTLVVHRFPGDYYRFSREAMETVLLEGLGAIEVEELLRPPRLLGSGIVP
jgi:SAM-dependent methyltransferase